MHVAFDMIGHFVIWNGFFLSIRYILVSFSSSTAPNRHFPFWCTFKPSQWCPVLLLLGSLQDYVCWERFCNLEINIAAERGRRGWWRWGWWWGRGWRGEQGFGGWVSGRSHYQGSWFLHKVKHEIVNAGWQWQWLLIKQLLYMPSFCEFFWLVIKH